MWALSQSAFAPITKLYRLEAVLEVGKLKIKMPVNLILGENLLPDL